jgi:hypothetical protein
MANAAPNLAAVNAPPTGDPRVRKLRPDEVQKLVDLGKTPRVCELEQLQAFFEGTQYAGRAHFFNDDVPLQERAPIICYKLCAVGVESNVAFAMGEGRFPQVLSLASENDQTFDKALGISDDESPVVDSFNAKLIDLARLEQVFRQAYRMAQASRSVAIVLGFRAGLPFADLVWSKLCSPSFDDPLAPERCTRLEIRYRYTEPWRHPTLTGGEWWTRVWEYLRVIDATSDTVYWPVAIWQDTDVGADAARSPVKSTTPHGFKFCPVHWYARNRESLVGTTPDGKALHDGQLGLLEQLDMAVSQRHRAAIYAGDPQTVLSGVSEDDLVGGTGRAARPALPDLNGAPAARQWRAAFDASGGNGGPRLRRGVGQVWQITDPAGRAILLTLPGDALKALDDDAKDLVSKACDALGVTLFDPSSVAGSGDLSGRTLAFLFSRQINRVSQDREDLGRCCILPVLNLFYRMILATKDGVYLPGLAKVTPILSRFYRPVAGATAPVWFAPQLKLKWGDYFEPSDADEATRVKAAIDAYTARIITLKSAVEHVRSVFTIGSVDQYVDALKDEQDERNAALHDAVAAMNASDPSKPGQGPPKAGAGGSSTASAPGAKGTAPAPKRASATS